MIQPLRVGGGSRGTSTQGGRCAATLGYETLTALRWKRGEDRRFGTVIKPHDRIAVSSTRRLSPKGCLRPVTRWVAPPATPELATAGGGWHAVTRRSRESACFEAARHADPTLRVVTACHPEIPISLNHYAIELAPFRLKARRFGAAPAVPF